MEIYSTDLPVTAMPDFVSGFIYGLTNDNQTDNIRSCYEAPSPDMISAEIQTGINALARGTDLEDDIAAGSAFGIFITQFESTLTKCEGLEYDLNWINQWSAIISDPEALGKEITENVMTYKQSMLVDRQFMLIDWQTNPDSTHYYWSGVDLANLAQDTIGRMPWPDTEPELSENAMPDFIAGFICGMTGDCSDEKKEYIEKCFEEVTPGKLANEVQKGINDLEKGGLENDIAAGRDFAMFVKDFPLAMVTCDWVDGDKQQISVWADIFQDPEALGKAVTENYQKNKVQIDHDEQSLVYEWDNEHYYDAGKWLASLSIDLVGPVPPETTAF